MKSKQKLYPTNLLQIQFIYDPVSGSVLVEYLQKVKDGMYVRIATDLAVVHSDEELEELVTKATHKALELGFSVEGQVIQFWTDDLTDH